MIYHILNGDGLAGSFKLSGERIICRECLIDGELRASSLDDFWIARAEFIEKTFRDVTYYEKSKSEFEKLGTIDSADEINLWFGNEAFCQVNMWFVLFLMVDRDAAIYRIFPDNDGWNCGFSDPDGCFELRRELKKDDIHLGMRLWKAYVNRDFDELMRLGSTETTNFRDLPHVCRALGEKDERPKEILRAIVGRGETDFARIFKQFSKAAPVYGFGDMQVQNLLNSL